MAVRTNNGFAAVDSSKGLQTIKVRNRSTRVRSGSAGFLLRWVAQQIDVNVEPCERLYGWRSPVENRLVGGVWDSNHISGTAIDYNGNRHPYEYTFRGAKWSDGWSQSQAARINAILALTGGVVEWGGNLSTRYRSPYRDPCHFEVRASADRVRAAAVALSRGTVKVKPGVVLIGRSKPSAKGEAKYRRAGGFKITYVQAVYREGRLWLKTRYGTWYAADYTTWSVG